MLVKSLPMNVWQFVGFGLALSFGSGNSNSGHDYGTKLSENQKRDSMEYLKTL